MGLPERHWEMGPVCHVFGDRVAPDRAVSVAKPGGVAVGHAEVDLVKQVVHPVERIIDRTVGVLLPARTIHNMILGDAVAPCEGARATAGKRGRLRQPQCHI